MTDDVICVIRCLVRVTFSQYSLFCDTYHIVALYRDMYHIAKQCIVRALLSWFSSYLHVIEVVGGIVFREIR